MKEKLLRKAVVALGGNAISPPGEVDSITTQFKRTRKSLDAIIDLLKQDIIPVITHGNGPQVGNAALRTEQLADSLPYLPLGINVADTEGGMGYMIEQSLLNRLREEGIKRKVVTLISQVLVDKADPSIEDPTKYIGTALPEAEAHEKAEQFGWNIKPISDGQWRRVVPSPQPINIINSSVVSQLIELGHIVIAVGGGGVPAFRDIDGNLEGLDAVIDKDKASALLGTQIGAELLYIFTNIERVALNFGQENEQLLANLTLAEAKQYLAQGHFPPGNMGPKIEASIQFLEGGGKQVIITSIESIKKDTSGQNGTIITH
ncbi:MAG: carbamate kinase [Candidatus Marinimicrobia bacterium]|nr:carbamate kinase [Candidatus Neomarinimicrobiota bacterium]MBT3632044.1 carbamate kinase [Candidatus Neomarinimicrobiota bacterium]MBT3824630.1 carbamate kinase [Candidatus Neomarinimicrobiota bacterium]MBT4130196.1 carbamate kinase [Candidatus Neomarinimicrobiota bacterium]MBT4296946.1 carbamate kinase [Candidatus Neomarinimicrobiota bacterium]